MNDQDLPASAENRLTEPESSPTPRGISPAGSGATSRGNRQQRQPATEAAKVKIVVRVAPAEPQSSGSSDGEVEVPVTGTANLPPLTNAKLVAEPPSAEAEQKARAENEPRQIPARMMNEFVYCQRLFYYEFVESADTLRGDAIHQRVDSGNGALPAAKNKPKSEKTEDKLSDRLIFSLKTPEHKATNRKPSTRVLSRWVRNDWALWPRWI